jgi:hypothetical protein
MCLQRAAGVPDCVRPCSGLTLGAALNAEETARLHFTIENDWGGVQPWGMLNDARVVVYRAAAWGRTITRGRG